MNERFSAVLEPLPESEQTWEEVDYRVMFPGMVGQFNTEQEFIASMAGTGYENVVKELKKVNPDLIITPIALTAVGLVSWACGALDNTPAPIPAAQATSAYTVTASSTLVEGNNNGGSTSDVQLAPTVPFTQTEIPFTSTPARNKPTPKPTTTPIPPTEIPATPTPALSSEQAAGLGLSPEQLSHYGVRQIKREGRTETVLVKKLANGTERIDYTEINGQWERGIRYVASKYPDLAGVLVSGILDNEDGQAVGIRDANVVLGQYLQAIATQKGISLEVLLTDLKANKGIINDVLIPTKVQGIISGAVPTLYDGTDTRTIDFNKPLTIRILAKQEKEGIKEEIQKKYEFVELDKTTANLFYVDDEGRLMYAYEVGGDGYLEHSLLQSKGYNLFLTSNMLASAAHLDKNLVAEMQGGSQKTSAADGWIANLRMNVFNKGTQKFPIKPVGSLTDFAALPNGTGSAMLIPFQSTSAATH